MISALKIRQRKFNFGQIPENMGTANLPLARKLGRIPPASEFYWEICLFLLTCKSKCKFVRVNATAKFKNFDSLLKIWGNSLFNGIECVKINSIRQEIGKKAKNSQRSDCRLLFCKGKSHPWKFSVWHLKCRVIMRVTSSATSETEQCHLARFHGYWASAKYHPRRWSWTVGVQTGCKRQV